SESLEDQAHALFDAPFVVVSHGADPDPILNYGNRAALELWEMTWEQFTQTPSRLTAEPLNQEERAAMLGIAGRQGYFEGYRGVRISSSGRRFLVEDATVWNVLDPAGRRIGQAATFARWSMLNE
ncbi:MAG: MEKHLA domain-containing protein, partial [Nitrospira sp.]|nr:MEKHLA domain-containing protein [Nitrospira sp.]